MKTFFEEDIMMIDGDSPRKLMSVYNDTMKIRCMEIVKHINKGESSSIFYALVNEYCDAFVLGAIEAYGLTVEGSSKDCYCYGCSVGYIRNLPIGEATVDKLKIKRGVSIQEAVILWLIKYEGGNIA